MHHILARRHIGVLERFAEGNVLVGFDYDGTLAPIHSDPQSARMRPITRRLLASVARRYPCVVISGRSRRDLERRLDGVPVCHLSGNYGLEPWEPRPRYIAQVQQWMRQLERRLAGRPGVVIEDKAYSITVHYRHARDKPRTIAAIEAAIADLRGCRSIAARQAISVLPAAASGKGAALDRTRRLLACDTAIYVGDDETDEEAFGGLAPETLLAVRVGTSRPSQAGYGLRRQADVDRLLAALVRLREPGRSRLRPPDSRLNSKHRRASIACA